MTKILELPFYGPFTTEEAADCGINSRQLNNLIEQGHVRRIARGVHIPAAAEPARASIIRANFDGCYISSFVVSAQMHQLWLPRHLPSPLLQPLRRDRLHGQHCEVVSGLLVTTLPWTAINLARYHHLDEAVIPLDSALRLGVPRDDLVNFAELMSRWRGTGHLMKAIELADARSESALESKGRIRFREIGLPMPVLQYPIRVGSKDYRADFAWPAQRVIVETDGLSKYKNPRAFEGEKLRERELQLAGWVVMRCGWAELLSKDSGFLNSLRSILIGPPAPSTEHRARVAHGKP